MDSPSVEPASAQDMERTTEEEEVDYQWWVARLVLQVRVGEDDTGPWLCDEQVRVIKAADKHQAYEKALRLGREQEDSYPNSDGEIVVWSFLGLSDLDMPLNGTIDDGTEITSNLSRETSPTSLVRRREELVPPRDALGNLDASATEKSDTAE